MDTAVTAEAQAASDRREFASEARSLAPLLAPRSVAVYGVRRDGSGLGAAVLAAIVRGGFHGTTVVVHPRAIETAGVPAYTSAAAAPGPVDLAVIAVPSEQVAAALEDAASAGVRAAVVIASGFAEVGATGAERQQELAVLARANGIRVVGPNCLGLLANAPEVRLDATFGGTVPRPGGLAVASQSGGVGIVLMDLVDRVGGGLRYLVSLGNKVDVSSNDLLAAWYGDPAVTCSALYLESFGNARKFARFARRFSERKPLLAVVGGRSSGGRRAGASHTAAAVTPAAGVRALFAQSGVIECDDAEQLAETALLLENEPLPDGRRLGVVSNAGGLGVLAADAAEDEGFEVVELSAALQHRVAGLVHQTTGTGNPVDAGAGADPDQVSAIVEAVLASGEVDAVVAVLVATATTDLNVTLRALSSVRREHPDRPLVAVPLGASTKAASGTTTFRSSAAALGALGRVARYADWRRARPSAVPPSDPVAVREARLDAARLLQDGTPDGWIAPGPASRLLRRYGVDLVGEVASGSAAPGVAASIGFPVAVKLAEADVVHKTEQGLVRTGLLSQDEVRAVVAGFESARGAPATVLVQPMLPGVELALGVLRDRALGPVVMVGAGGVATEVHADRALLLPPFDAGEVLRALRSLRVWRLLEGYRGAAPVDVDALTRLVADLGRLAVDVPEVAELDLNPVLARPEGCAVVDIKLRLVEVGGDGVEDLSQRRQLRRVR
jgi:acyl-CoA synthetase (NDP forming)